MPFSGISSDRRCRYYLKYWVNPTMFLSICRHDSTCRYDTQGNLFEWLIRSFDHFHSRRHDSTRSRLVQECVGTDFVERTRPLLYRRDHQICRSMPERSDSPSPTDSNVAGRWNTHPLEAHNDIGQDSDPAAFTHVFSATWRREEELRNFESSSDSSSLP